MKYPMTILCGLPALLLTGMTIALPVASNPPAKQLPTTARKLAGITDRSRTQAFLKQNCLACHGPKLQRSGLRLDTLTVDFSDKHAAARWLEIRDRIIKGDMPPEGSPHPAPKAASWFTEWITSQLQVAEAKQSGNGGRVVLRRLNRREYENTIRDLFGIPLPIQENFPEDPTQFGFDNIGSTLQISPALMQRYVAVAASVLDHVLITGSRPKTDTNHYDPARLDFRISDLAVTNKEAKTWRMHRGPCLPEQGTAAIPLEFYRTGLYKARIHLSGVHEPEQPASHLVLKLDEPTITFFNQDVESAEDKPITLETMAWIPAGVHWAQLRNELDEHQPRINEMWEWRDKKTSKLLAPMLFIDWIEFEGPLYDSWPTSTFKRVFYKGEDTPKDLSYTREILKRFMDRAFRRPAEATEVNHMVALVGSAMEHHESFENSVKLALQTVLCSPNFLYLTEPSSSSGTRSLTDYELASRLSYFLWSTMPDETLLQAAAKGSLHVQKEMTRQIERMLKDPKAAALTNDFAYQWLQLNRVGQFQPDRHLYPAYDPQVQEAIVGETKAFFSEVLTNNLSVLNFIRSDWTMLNGRMAAFYGIPDIHGDRFRKVALKPEYHRGGIMTQANILSLTSDGTRHRPVYRGVWILNALLNTPPPLPPPNVPSIDVSTGNMAKLSVRGRMEAHRSNEVCASCHRKIDPLGLAFEHYDAIGHWRETEMASNSTEALALDASGKLPNGKTFEGAAGLEKMLINDPDPFLHSLCEKMLIYATGRGLEYSDQTTVAHLQRDLKQNGFSLKGLIIDIACSKPFNTK